MLLLSLPDGTRLRIENLLDQVYSMEAEDGAQYHWNASQGERMARARGEVVWVSLAKMGITLDCIRTQYADLDEGYALTTDLTHPLLFVPFGRSSQLIDGWHRLFKAAFLGIEELPAYLLTQQEANAILLCKLPPGKGVDWGQHAGSGG